MDKIENHTSPEKLLRQITVEAVRLLCQTANCWSPTTAK